MKELFNTYFYFFFYFYFSNKVKREFVCIKTHESRLRASGIFY